jgi:Ca2+-transporting ATPase
MTSPYPYTRAEECSWQPEEVARHISSLAKTKHSPSSTDASPLSSTHILSHGWSTHQVPYLRHTFGSNIMGADKDDPQSKYRIFQLCPYLLPIFGALGEQLKEPLIIMLLFSAAISLLLGNKADAISIGIALLIVSLVAAVQEYRSEQALEKLAHLVPHTCTVLRDARVLGAFPAKELVVGDLVLLGTGDRVPADCRVVDSVELAVDESSLTGENHPVTKTGEGLSIGTAPPPLTQQGNIVFCGTLCNAGRGRAIVVAVGDRTEFGLVATELASVTTRKSPLQLKIDELGKRLAYFSSAAILAIAVSGVLLGRPFLETLTVAVSLAVAAIPEGLPICTTVTLALGVLRMSKHNAIVKKLPVVESLGCTTAICSDKTGTLTQNEMTVRAAFTLAFPRRKFGFTGVGYEFMSGKLMAVSEAINNSPAQQVDETSEEHLALSALLNTACLCNNATVIQSLETRLCEGVSGGAMSGQPTELALLVAAEKAGIADPRPQYHRVQEIPFSSERKRMEVRARPVGGIHCCKAFTIALEVESSTASPNSSRTFADGSMHFVKGMPEGVLGECKLHVAPDGSAVPLTDELKTQVLTESRRMAASGLRVLAMAYGASLERLTFAGVVGMEDPPRKGVAESVWQLRRGGVKVMMVTGDAKETALAIARRCGILGSADGDADENLEKSLHSFGDSDTASDFGLSDVELGGSVALSGAELDSIPPQNLAESIIGVRVFYRVAPRHKLAIVRALQAHGDIVAMTGDGVNDATALKGADIGVAMGRKGTDVAKEAADVILADDDFRTITMAIAEGKGIFFNIRCFLSFQLSTSFAALTMASIATALGLPTPLNAMQILWINIIMDGPPAQSLGVEPVDDRILRAKPRKADDPVVTRALLMRAISSAALIVYLTLKVFANELDDGKVSRRDTTMTFMTFVNCDLFNAYVCRSADLCFYELNFFGNPAFLYSVGGSVLGQLMVIYFPPLQEVFQTESLYLLDLVYIVLLSSTVLWLDTLRKKFFKSFFSDGFKGSPVAKKEDPPLLSNEPWVGSSFQQSKKDKARRKNRSWLNPRSLQRGTPKSGKSKSILAL